MPVYIGDLTSEISAMDGEMPLTDEQVENLVRLVLTRLDQRDRDRQMSRESTMVTRRCAQAKSTTGGQGD